MWQLRVIVLLYVITGAISGGPIIFPKTTNQRLSEQACEAYYPPLTSTAEGSAIVDNEYSYVVALGSATSEPSIYKYFCSGTLISREYVLTVAHCLKHKQPDVVLPGGANLTDTTTPTIEIASTIIHPDYSNGKLNHDIALIKLQQKIFDTPACLWTKDTLESNELTAIGYGPTKRFGPISKQIRKATLLVTSKENCSIHYENKKALPNGIEDNHLCAIDAEEGNCGNFQISGGPLVYMDLNKRYHHVVGITSFGELCSPNVPGVYMRVSKYLDWIENIVWPDGKI